jgi:hypothetical protein
VQARLETLRLLQARMLTITRLTDLLNQPNLRRSTAVLIEDLLAHELSEMRAFGDPGRPYSRMCAQLIASFMA